MENGVFGGLFDMDGNGNMDEFELDFENASGNGLLDDEPDANDMEDDWDADSDDEEEEYDEEDEETQEDW